MDLLWLLYMTPRPSSALYKMWDVFQLRGLDGQVVYAVYRQVVSVEEIIVDHGLEDCVVCEACFVFCIKAV